MILGELCCMKSVLKNPEKQVWQVTTSFVAHTVARPLMVMGNEPGKIIKHLRGFLSLQRNR